MARKTRRVWFCLAPGAELLDLSGPWEVLAHANDVLGRQAYEQVLISANGGSIPTRHGIVVAHAKRLPDKPTRLPDTVIITGGSAELPFPAAETRFARWLRRHQSGIVQIVSICAGAFVLGEAGLLDGRRATTHWRDVHALRNRFPRADVQDHGVYVRDGKVWTSAGITAGIDLTLALVEEQQGREVAMAVARKLVLFLRRSGNQAQFSSALQRQAQQPARQSDLVQYIVDHLAEPLPVERLAHASGMSVRSLSRWTRTHLGLSPAELVRQQRLEEARRLLEDANLSLKEIAGQTGLGDVSTLWRAFRRSFGVSPAAYRERFGAPS